MTTAIAIMFGIALGMCISEVTEFIDTHNKEEQ